MRVIRPRVDVQYPGWRRLLADVEPEVSMCLYGILEDGAAELDEYAHLKDYLNTAQMEGPVSRLCQALSDLFGLVADIEQEMESGFDLDDEDLWDEEL